MKIVEKLVYNNQNCRQNPFVTIAFSGDSVTQGCFRSHQDYEAVYHNIIKKKLTLLFKNVVVNIINAGIGGTTAEFGAERVGRDVISKNPDLCVVCFGLNDSGGMEEGIELYKKSLEKIFTELTKNNIETIFMTPNMMNTYYVDIITPQQYTEAAKDTADRQNKGIMDMYMKAGIETADKCGIKVCDCYGKWKKLAEQGVDTTQLLSNGINHPLREMHELFANSLLDTMFD